MSNFSFLLTNPQFKSFAQTAITAEKLLSIDVESAAINCRRAMEFAVKWMYSVDSALHRPYDSSLYGLMSTEEFRDVVGGDLFSRMKLIRIVGNRAAHQSQNVKAEEVALCLENLFVFLDFVAYCYGSAPYTEPHYNKALALQNDETPPKLTPEIDFEALILENETLKKALTERRETQAVSYTPKPLELSEYETRKIYIDTMLKEADWQEGKNWLNEVRVEGMPNQKQEGFVDYVLYGDDGRPLALLEAKRTCVDVSKGRQQAKLYADCLEKQYGRRPVIFLSNGFDTRISDGQYPERTVAALYSKRDLEKWFNLRKMRQSLAHIRVKEAIAGRYYQESAIKAVCTAFDEKNRRKALLVMATGSGKTRTVIALCEVLLQHGWAKNILFLADRTALVIQAKRNFVNLLPDLSVANLCEEKTTPTAHCIFSTYQTMMGCIDETRDEEGKLFTPGHFDLVICDEAHRSIYNKYRDIFSYFDAPLIGLTATPKDDIDKNTYDRFALDNGNPTYGYELSQAVKDGYLVDFLSVETTLKFLQQGIAYDELSDEEKADYENTFEDENGELPERIASSALNRWIFNEDTIQKALHVLMSEGLHIEYGKKIGKTIVFAKNHAHAEKIYEVFCKTYPHLNGYAKVIDNQMNYAQSAIDEFSEAEKLPQIAISVDMLDTGIDVPEVLNLVFFKKVMSKAKFWQMIGRGTRLCPGLIDGADKTKFYIFDFCGNFEFFRMNKGKATKNTLSLQGSLFFLKAQMAFKLQALEYQTEALIAFRESLVEDLVQKVSELDRNHFAVRQHLKYVELYQDTTTYKALSYEDTLQMREHLAPLVLPEEDEASALRFDALLYSLEFALLSASVHSKAKSDLYKRARELSEHANLPQVQKVAELLGQILNTDYVENASVFEFEHIRTSLRHLIKFIPKQGQMYSTNFTDDLLNIEWKTSELESDDLQNYRARAEFYIREHEAEPVIQKLKSNTPLCQNDMQNLEAILWKEVGTRDDYEANCGQKPLGEFVREIVGLSMNAAKDAFSAYLNDANLNSRQIYFVNQIIEYIVHNGLMKDLSVLQEPPFTNEGSVADVFDDVRIWQGIRQVIEQINANVAA